jgi:hypothetical protein
VIGGPRLHLPAERLYALVLSLYPADFRAEYGAEMTEAFRDWRAGRPGHGMAALRFWADVLLDTAAGVPREWVRAIRERAIGGRGRARPTVTSDAEPAPPYRWAAVSALVVFLLYVATLAPTIGFWDSGEYVTATHILGIPHPPGSPLFVLLGHAWESLLAPTGLPVAVRVNLFTAVFMAAAHGFWFLVVDRALAGASSGRVLRRVGAAAAVVVSATAFTVWNQADVTEKVYAICFFTTALVTWLALRWRDTGRKTRDLVVVAVVLALSATNHLMGVLVVPALLAFVLLVDGRALLRPRLWLAGVPLVALALSVQLFLPVRAAQRPVLSEADPTCPSAVSAVESVYTAGHAGCEALSSALTRKQYGKPPITADPTVYPQEVRPRSASLIAAQVLNYAQYFDWQWARSVAGHHTLFGGARPLFTLAFLVLGLAGLATLRRRDAAGTAYLIVLFATLSLGLVAYLNFRYGYSTGHGRYPMAEVRERDYFFVIGFSVWGLLAGMGIATVWARAAAFLGNRIRWPRLAAAPVLALALLPVMLNGHWASRANDYAARDWAYNVLMSVRPYGVLFTNGDNDTFPLWYVQEVEGVRRDVTVIVGSYLGSAWYARQIRDLTRPCPPGVDPGRTPTRIVCQRPFVPGALPAPLVKAGWARSARPPRDSVLPLTDAQIRQVAARAFVAREGMTLHAGAIDTTIRAGTTLLPSDTFTAAILQHALGRRPIYFMPGSPAVAKLGLFPHTVREGIAWRIENGPVGGPSENVVKLPDNSLTPVAGAAIDLATTDTLVWKVYQRRGRILNPANPWVDAATTDILMQYVYTNYAAAEGHELRGDTRSAARSVKQAEWWQSVAGE